VSFLIEMIVDGAVDRGELLECLHPAKPEHRSLSSSERLMRVFGSVVDSASNLLSISITDLVQSGTVRAQTICHDGAGFAMALHRTLDEFECRSLVFSLAGKEFQHFAFVIDCSPEIVHLAVDLHEDFVQVPSPMGVSAHPIDPLLADFGGEHWAETVPPEPDGFVANGDPALGEQVFDIAKRQRPFDIHHDHEADDLARAVGIAEHISYCLRLAAPPTGRNFGRTEPAWAVTTAAA
jgi:hypothetical protein